MAAVSEGLEPSGRVIIDVVDQSGVANVRENLYGVVEERPGRQKGDNGQRGNKSRS